MRKHTPFGSSERVEESEEDRRFTEHKQQFFRFLSDRKQRAKEQAKSKKIVTLDETPALKRRRWEKIAADFKPYEEYSKIIAGIDSADEHVKDEMMLKLGNQFIKTAQRGNADKLQAFIEEGFPVNYQHPKTGQTVLHVTAACKAREALRGILGTGQCDFLIRDSRGRLASEMAFLYGEDPALARLLRIKERKQAESEGVKLTRRPPRINA